MLPARNPMFKDTLVDGFARPSTAGGMAVAIGEQLRKPLHVSLASAFFLPAFE